MTRGEDCHTPPCGELESTGVPATSVPSPRTLWGHSGLYVLLGVEKVKDLHSQPTKLRLPALRSGFVCPKYFFERLLGGMVPGVRGQIRVERGPAGPLSLGQSGGGRGTARWVPSPVSEGQGPGHPGGPPVRAQ